MAQTICCFILYSVPGLSAKTLSGRQSIKEEKCTSSEPAAIDNRNLKSELTLIHFKV